MKRSTLSIITLAMLVFVFEGKELSTDSAGTWRVKVDRKTRKEEATDYVLTYRDGEVSVLAETSDYARGNSLGWNAFQNWPKVHVPSGDTVTVTLPVVR